MVITHLKLVIHWLVLARGYKVEVAPIRIPGRRVIPEGRCCEFVGASGRCTENLDTSYVGHGNIAVGKPFPTWGPGCTNIVAQHNALIMPMQIKDLPRFIHVNDYWELGSLVGVFKKPNALVGLQMRLRGQGAEHPLERN